jgi:hypothetical protein
LAVDATVTFITALDQITLRITNLQTETGGSVAQTISAVDFHLQGLTGSSLSPTLFSWQGEAGDLTAGTGGNATFADGTRVYNSTGGNLANRWTIFTTCCNANGSGNQIAGGIQITTLSGGNPDETILGPPNTNPNTYKANNGLVNDSPLLRTLPTTYIEYVIHFSAGSGVTSSTVVNAARMSWNTAFAAGTELDLISQTTPEPGTWGMLIGGFGLLAVGRWRRGK